MKRLLILFFAIFIFYTESEAARSFTVTNLAGNSVNYYMRDVVTMTLRVTNTNTPPDTNDGIRIVRVTYPTGMTVNTTGHVAPTGWTVAVDTANNRVTFTTNTDPYISGQFRDFGISLTPQAATTDVAQVLTEVRVTYVSTRRVTVGPVNNVAWTRRGLKITSMVASPDLLTSGDPFTLTITVQNVSSATQTTITANPNPPSETQTGGFNPSTSSNPSIASLGVLSTANLVYNYTTQTNDEGSVYFTCNVRNGANNTTGISTNSNIVYIGRFYASITYTPQCPLSGETITVNMTVTNTNTFSLSNVVPTLTTSGTATLTLLSGPTPASIASLSSGGGTGTFTYTYRVTGNFDSTFLFSGYAVGQKTTPPTGTRQTPTYTTAVGYLREYSLNISPSAVVSNSKGFFLHFTLYNRANNLCPIDSNYNIKRLTVTIPSSFSYSSINSSYIVGNNITNPADPNSEYYTENWTISDSSNQITFSSNNVTFDLPTMRDADFSIFIVSAPTVNSDTNFTFSSTLENNKGTIINQTGSNVQLKVQPDSTGMTRKPVPTKGGVRERHD